MEQIKISPRNLGTLRLPDFCPRCFWISLRCEGKLPFQIPMPGIFSSIDAYGKNLIRTYFDHHHTLPPWFPKIGEVIGYVPSRDLHWSKFKLIDQQTQILLRGTPDDIFHLSDGSYHIVDYKTATVTKTQNHLFPLYEVQLNAYAAICKERGLSSVTGLSLIYTEPQTSVDQHNVAVLMSNDTFSMKFKATLKQVRLCPDEIIPPLLQRAREIFELRDPPNGKQSCKDCELLEKLLQIVVKKVVP